MLTVFILTMKSKRIKKTPNFPIQYSKENAPCDIVFLCEIRNIVQTTMSSLGTINPFNPVNNGQNVKIFGIWSEIIIYT